MLLSREVSRDAPVVVYKEDDLSVEAMHIPHGIVPAVAFRVTAGGEIFVFSSDQNGSDAAFVDFAKDASILVMHLVVPESATGVASRLHARPSIIGKVAAQTGAQKLVLGHFMARSLREIDKNVELVREAYDGHVILAEDLRRGWSQRRMIEVRQAAQSAIPRRSTQRYRHPSTAHCDSPFH